MIIIVIIIIIIIIILMIINNLTCAFYVPLKVGNNRDFSLGFNCRTILFNITQMKANDECVTINNEHSKHRENM